MASGNEEAFRKLRQQLGQTMCEACKRMYNEHSDDELLGCLHQIASKERALKKAEGELVPPVDAEELKSRWKNKTPWTCQTSQEAKIHQWAVTRRVAMIATLVHWNRHGQLLTPWKRGEEFDDAVFQIAATFPMRSLPHRVYHIAGDEYFGFDPNAFVQQLIKETGVPHTWEPIETRVPEGNCGFSFLRGSFKGHAAPTKRLFEDEHEAKRCTREVFWDAWDKYQNIESPERIGTELYGRLVATQFADFMIDNLDLAQQLMSHFNADRGDSFAIVTELERRAMRWRDWRTQSP